MDKATCLFPLSDVKQLLRQEEWWDIAQAWFVYGGSAGNYSYCQIHLPYSDAELILDIKEDALGTIKVNGHQSTSDTRLAQQLRSFRSKRPERVVAHITETFNVYTKIIDQKQSAAEAAEQERQRIIKQRKALVESFGVPLDWNQDSIYSTDIRFRMGPKYYLEFSSPAREFDQEFPFKEVSFGGQFTKDQIAELIEWLARCPQAVAERILDGKK